MPTDDDTASPHAPDVSDAPNVSGVPEEPAEGEATVPAPSGPEVVLAVDVGAEVFQVGLVTSKGALIDRLRAPIQTDVGPESHYTDLANLVTEMLERAAAQHEVVVRSVGVGCGGPASRGLEEVSPMGLTSWRDFPLRSRIADLTGLPVFGDLDAKALALAEGWLGAARGHADFCAITVSAGITGGIVLDGDLLDGESGYAGHIGHMIVEPGGRRCHCGTQGCLDAEASGAAIEVITGRPPSEPTYEIMQRTGRLIGRAAASVCNAFDLPLVVVGGSVALGFGATFFHDAQVTLDDHARLPYSRGARITPSRLGDTGPLVGAGALGWRGIRRARRAGAGAGQPPKAR